MRNGLVGSSCHLCLKYQEKKIFIFFFHFFSEGKKHSDLGHTEVSLHRALFLGPPLANFYLLLRSGDLSKNEGTPGRILEMIFYWEGAKTFGLSFPRRQSKFSVGMMPAWVPVAWWHCGCGPATASSSIAST